MSLQALMALMGHMSAEMTLRYASLASPTIRAAYDAAMTKVRGRLPLLDVTTGKPAAPDRVEWLRSEMLKTRVAHGYCSRNLVAEACPYANICEQCDNYVTAPQFIPALQAQLADIHAVHDDAQHRGLALRSRPPRPSHRQHRRTPATAQEPRKPERPA